MVAALAVAAPAAHAADRQRTDAAERRVETVARELRCPVCQNLSVWESQSTAAHTFRLRIRRLVAQGATDAQIRDYFTARYGDWILLSPPKRGIGLAVWLAPLAILAGGVAAAAVTVRQWRRRAAALAAARGEGLAAARARLDELERTLES